MPEIKLEGVKYDGGKAQYGLLPPSALKEVVDVLTIGAVKYAPGNWAKVPHAQTRYFNAGQRHIWTWKAGEGLDPETGKNHLAHAICCLLFMLEKDIIGEAEWEAYKRDVLKID